jgi:hypothetical protein
MNSIANEVWALGREHFVRVLTGPEEMGELVAEARSRLGRCDVVVSGYGTAEVGGVPAVMKADTAAATVGALLARVES